MNRFFKEPLLHFLLIGAAFFLLYGLVGEEESSDRKIVIDESDLNEIVSKFEVQWKRAPTEEELISIVDKRIEQEVFYQEALKMNLDHNDEIIKRRLSQKMQFLSDDISGLIDPTEDQLGQYFESHSDRYQVDAKYTLYQIFFSPDSRDDWENDAATIRDDLNDLAIEDALQKGDPIALPQFFENTLSFHLSRQLGQEFVQNIEPLPIGSWQGPVRSGYGAHLVFIKEKVDQQTALFEDVRQQVLDDYNYERKQETQATILREFLKKYDIEFDIQDDSYSEAFINRLKSQRIVE